MQTQRFQGTARTITQMPNGGARFYTYHSTAVVTVFADKTIRLDSGGWMTATTKRAMNQASNQDELGFQVFQKAGKWFVRWQGRDLPFTDGLVLNFVPVEA
jgi:hypothetical protein